MASDPPPPPGDDDWRERFGGELAEMIELMGAWARVAPPGVSVSAAALAHATMLIDLCAHLGRDPIAALAAARAISDAAGRALREFGEDEDA